MGNREPLSNDGQVLVDENHVFLWAGDRRPMELVSCAEHYFYAEEPAQGRQVDRNLFAQPVFRKQVPRGIAWIQISHFLSSRTNLTSVNTLDKLYNNFYLAP